MSIWFKPYRIEDLQDKIANTLAEALGIILTEITSDSLKCKMEVMPKTKQSMGVLHGGASAALCETLGSIASNLIVDIEHFYCLGLDINASHIRPVFEGFVFAEAKPVHLGRKTHVWRIDITNADNKLICTSRLTMIVLKVADKKKSLQTYS